MKVEHITAAPTCDGSEGMLASVVRAYAQPLSRSGTTPSVEFATPPDAQLQVGKLMFAEGQSCEAHRHAPVDRVVYRTEEVLIVTAGSLTVTIYNSAGKFERMVNLLAGDLIIFHAGGHGVMTQTYAEVIEVKQGPYAGVNDKVRFGAA